MKNVKNLFLLCILIIFVGGCSNVDSKGIGKRQVNFHEEDFLMNLPSENLSVEEIKALNLTLNDEYKAEAIYQKVIDKFGKVNPFNNIISAERRHSDSLIELYNKYNLVVPENDWFDKVEEYDSIKSACEAGIVAEVENIELYDELFSDVDNEDITLVFTSLRDASRDKHLPAFERCASR